jgi:3-methylcrotonyl-CoA carboxylase alpha subunit
VADTLLVANRGEIACRVIRTARRMGLRAVAVYSDADRDALHVRMADAALRIGPAPAVESYLRVDAVVEAARAAGAWALHPGYGFLAESPDLAEACTAAGVVFVGPPAAAIRAMGDKPEARALAAAAGVPVVPGADLDGVADPVVAARSVGYPLMVKAAAGGGGRGMRVVADEAGLADGLAAAGREAGAAFGDSRLLVERLIAPARHVEVQVLGDARGTLVALGDRDCSLQRRHQKVVEEAPAPDLPETLRAGLHEAALSVARAVGYANAGTVEFLVADDAFWFLEMNTRLQVEHPVTEEVGGLDVVEWQLRVAAGEPLPGDLWSPRGHAVEARLYAEDPARGLLPAAGRLDHLRLPAGDGVRVDAGVRTGDAVGIEYDSLLAKIVAAGPDRAEALRRLARALAACQVVGMATNLELLKALVADPDVVAGPVDTGHLERRLPEILVPPGPASESALALAALSVIVARRAPADAAPWSATDGWRPNAGPASQDLVLHDGEREVVVALTAEGDGYAIDLPSGRVRARGSADGGDLVAALDDRTLRATVVRAGAEIVVFADGRRESVRLVDPGAGAQAAAAAAGGLTAPMPAQVRSVLVRPGDLVERGDPLVVLEAMKMELTVSATAAGRVLEVRSAVGDRVDEGTELLTLEVQP